MARPSGHYRIRIAKATDIAALVAHRKEMFEEIGIADKRRIAAMTKAFKSWLRREMAAGRYKTWLAVDSGGEIAAGAGLWITGWPPVPYDTTSHRGYVLNVYTQPAHRRRGLARSLMKALLSWCRKRGFRVITLHASDAGRPLYESLGFEPTREMRLRLYAMRRSGKRISRQPAAGRLSLQRA